MNRGSSARWTRAGAVALCAAFAGVPAARAQDAPAPRGEESDPALGTQINITLIAEDRDLRAVACESSRKAGVDISVDNNVEETVNVSLFNQPWRRVLEVVARDAGVEVEQRDSRLFYLTKPPRVYMEFANAPVREVFELLAQYAGKNVVIASDVTGNVTVNLKNVHWWRALQTIAKTAGYVAVQEDGDLIRIVRPESLKIQLSTRVYVLKYIRPPEDYRAIITSGGNQETSSGELFLANDTKPSGLEDFTLLKALQKMVDEKTGETLDYDPKSNSFLVTATATKHADIEALLEKIDILPDQVFVKVRFITTSNRDFWRAGLQFGNPLNPDAAGFRAALNLDNTFATDFTEPGVPSDAGNFLGQFPFVFGNANEFFNAFNVPAILDFSSMQIIAQFVDIDRNSKVTQSPTLMSLNGRPAVIFVGEKVPFAQQRANVDANGTVTVTLQESPRSPQDVGFTLFMTPHIVRDTDQIILTIIPRVTRLTGTGSNVAGLERFSFIDAAGNETFIDLPRVFDQTVVTNLLVRDGQTAVIGGLLQETIQEIEQRIPLLSSIPIIGNLFTFESKNYEQENQIIFITPTIVRDEAQSASLFRTQYQIFQETDFFYNKYVKDESGNPPARPKGLKPVTSVGAANPEAASGRGAPLGAGYGEPAPAPAPAQPGAEPPAAEPSTPAAPAQPAGVVEPAPAPVEPAPLTPEAPPSGEQPAPPPPPEPSVEPVTPGGSSALPPAGGAAALALGRVGSLAASTTTSERARHHDPENADQRPRVRGV